MYLRLWRTGVFIPFLPMHRGVVQQVRRFRPPTRVLRPGTKTTLILSIIFQRITITSETSSPYPFLIGLRISGEEFIITCPVLRDVLSRKSRGREHRLDF